MSFYLKLRHLKFFTLLEVVISLAVLSMGLAGFFSLGASAQRRVANAQEKWRNQHMLMQAAEYYLIYGEDAPEIPSDVFPYQPGYSARCEYSEVEDLPENYYYNDENTRLRNVTVELVRNSDNKTLGTVKVDRYIESEE